MKIIGPQTQISSYSKLHGRKNKLPCHCCLLAPAGGSALAGWSWPDVQPYWHYRETHEISTVPPAHRGTQVLCIKTLLTYGGLKGKDNRKHHISRWPHHHWASASQSKGVAMHWWTQVQTQSRKGCTQKGMLLGQKPESRRARRAQGRVQSGSWQGTNPSRLGLWAAQRAGQVGQNSQRLKLSFHCEQIHPLQCRLAHISTWVITVCLVRRPTVLKLDGLISSSQYFWNTDADRCRWALWVRAVAMGLYWFELIPVCDCCALML